MHPIPRIARLASVLTSAASLVLCAGCDNDPKDPNARLSADEGAALLHDIRDNPDRMTSLTPAERKYLLEVRAKK